MRDSRKKTERAPRARRPALPPVLLLVLLPMLVLGCGCTASGGIRADSFLASEDKAGRPSDGFPAPNQELVWEAAMRVVREQGYVPDPAGSTAASGRVQTRWHSSLQPFAGRGYREQVTVQVLRVAGRPGVYRLDTNVIRQTNGNLTEPSNPMAAEWTAGTRNEAREQLINQRVALEFLPGDVSPEFRRRYGLPEREDPRVPSPPPAKEDSGPFDFLE